jgi:hypothetical protein
MGDIQDRNGFYLAQTSSQKTTKQRRVAKTSIQNLDGFSTVIVIPAFGGA